MAAARRVPPFTILPLSCSSFLPLCGPTRNRPTVKYISLLANQEQGMEQCMVREHASHQCGPGSNPGDNAFSQLWLEFFVGSLPCSAKPFPGYSAFSHLLKNQHFPIRPGMVKEEPLRGYATFKSLFINLFYIKGAPSTSLHCGHALHRNYLL